MTVGHLIEILEQFPRDQVAEIGFLTEEDPEWLICLEIADIVLSEDTLAIIDKDSSELMQRLIGVKLNIGKRGQASKEGEEGPGDDAKAAAG